VPTNTYGSARPMRKLYRTCPVAVVREGRKSVPAVPFTSNAKPGHEAAHFLKKAALQIRLRS
jgi:hypothetical protein